MSNFEQSAWLWLLALPRRTIPKGTSGQRYRELTQRQIKLELSPGSLHGAPGAPLVRVSALLPGCETRLYGVGNSLYTACDRLQHEFWNEGVKLPFLSVFHVTRENHE